MHGIGAGVRLGQPEAATDLTFRDARQPLALLLFRAIEIDHLAREERGEDEDRADRGAAVRGLLGGDDEFHHAAACAAVFLGEDQSEQPGLDHLGHELERVARLVVELAVEVGRALALDEVLQHLAEGLLLGRESEVHQASVISWGLNLGSLSFTWNASSSSSSNHTRTGMPIDTPSGSMSVTFDVMIGPSSS